MSATRGAPARIRDGRKFDPGDGLVRHVVEIGGAGRDLPPRARRNGPVAVAFGRCGDVHAAEPPRLRDRARRPRPRIDVARGPALPREVEGHGRELHLRPALEEQHPVARGDFEQPAQARLEIGRERHERPVAVAQLDDGSPRAVPVRQLLADPAQNPVRAGRTAPR